MTAPLPVRPRVGFVAELRTHGSRTALLADTPVTYAELADLVDDRATTLGTTRRLVLLTLTPNVDAVVTYLACLAGGHPVLLTGASAAPALMEAYDPDVVAGSGSLDVRRDGSTHALHPDLALLLSTSGSTGSPKLVRLSHDNLQSNAEAIAESLAIRATDCAITSLPLHYCYGLSVLHTHLLRGAAVALTPLSVTEGCFWDLVRAHGVTTLAGVPHTFALLDRVGFTAMDLPSLRCVTQAGGRLDPADVRRYAEIGQRRGWDLVVMYGQTEATARMAYLPPEQALAHPDAIGRAIPGGQLSLEDDELVYRGPNVMLGYAEGPSDLALGRTVDALRTGDLGRVTDDGLYEIVGRRSRLLKIYGLRLDLDRLECALDRPGREVACVGDDTELVVAVAGDPQDLREQAASAAGLPRRAVRVLRVASLPRTPHGKLDRSPLMRELAAAPPAVDAAPPGSVQALYAELLDRPDATPTDSFVDLGGDSLSFVEVSLRLEQLLGHLPSGWHLLPVGALERERRAPRRGRSLDTSVLLRAVAIVLVVAHHAKVVQLLGGAHLLLGVAGFNYARFQLTDAPRRARAGRLLRSVGRIVVPTVLAIGVTTLVLGRYDWRHLLLVHDLLAPGQMYQHFWFIEVLVQLMLAMGLLLAFGVVDRLERRRPLLVPWMVLAVGLAVRFDVLPGLEGKPRLYAPYAALWLFAWGWAAARSSTSWQRGLLTAVLLGALPGFFLGSTQREIVVGSGLLLLLWLPQVRVPRAVASAAGVLAAASLYVYVSHFLVVKHPSEPVVAFVASFAVGLTYWQLMTRAGRLLPRRLASRGSSVTRNRPVRLTLQG